MIKLPNIDLNEISGQEKENLPPTLLCYNSTSVFKNVLIYSFIRLDTSH